MDSTESHRRFISKHGLNDLTLLSDTDGRVAKSYGADHWLFPVAARMFVIVDSGGTIVFEKKTGIFPLKNQTETLLRELDGIGAAASTH